MAHPAINSQIHRLQRLQLAIDKFWAGVWWLHLQLWLQDRRLAKVLEETGDRSMATRGVTEKFRRLERGRHYWRASPSLVQSALEVSENAGVPLADLRLLAVNREIRQTGSAVHVVNSRAILLIAYPVLTLTFIYWAALTTLFALADAPVVTKFVAITLTTLVYWFLGSGLCLYTTRPYAAAKRSGARIQSSAQQIGSQQATAWRSPA
ncbi:MAG: hypothetical protein RSB86_04095 [Comamonas sp.]|uniref:hypothetical protein n=1 Tax=Comamonas sp. TaxID=34028 RepID=UPI002FCB1D7E